MLKIAHKKKPSQIKSNLPTILFRGLCETSGVYTKKTLTFARKLCRKNSHGTLSNPDLSKKRKDPLHKFNSYEFFWTVPSVHFIFKSVEEKRIETSSNKNPPPKARMLASFGWLVSEKPHFEGKKIRLWNHLSEVLLHFNQCLGSLYLGSCHFDVTGVVVVVTSWMNWTINERGGT